MEPRTVEVTGTLHLLMRIRSGDIRITQIDSTTATVHVTGERKSDEISIETDPVREDAQARPGHQGMMPA
jgi:mRNA-degrading endonuclease RelE of RelBE toxin-antitoxin system